MAYVMNQDIGGIVTFENYIWFSAGYLILLLAYSLYLLYLNKRQANVYKEVRQTNYILERVLEQLTIMNKRKR